MAGERARAHGLDPERLAVADRHVREGLKAGVYGAAVLLVARGGRTAHRSAFGETAPGCPATANTVFDLASLTKPVVATALLTLIEDGALFFHQTVEDLLPEAAGAPCGGLLVRDLATHVSGLPAWRPLHARGRGPRGILEAIYETPLQRGAGVRYEYSDLGYILLGAIAGRLAGEGGLAGLVERRVFAPLGMGSTGYLPAAERRRRIAPTAHCPMRPGETLVGEVHDANCHAAGGVTGHAGLFGTADDLARLGSALILGGTYRGRRLLGLPAVRRACASQIDPAVGGQTIGWFAAPNPMLPRGDLLGDSAFGHTGFTGTMVVCDPVLDLVLVLLTNRVRMPGDNGGIQRVRRRVCNAVASAVVARARVPGRRVQ